MKCNKCGKQLEQISCPDDIVGCLVMHFAECNCEEEVNLSKKRRELWKKMRKVGVELPYWFDKEVEKQDKEFIRLLKLNMNLTYENCLVIDKLAGKELI